MKIIPLMIALLFSLSAPVFAQNKSVENEKFALLNNGATIGMIVKSVIKADTKRLKLTDQQIPKAKEIITNATVKFNDGVKTLKKSGMSGPKLRGAGHCRRNRKTLRLQSHPDPGAVRYSGGQS